MPRSGRFRLYDGGKSNHFLPCEYQSSFREFSLTLQNILYAIRVSLFRMKNSRKNFRLLRREISKEQNRKGLSCHTHRSLFFLLTLLLFSNLKVSRSF